jgi:hypothetical protein
MEEARLFLFLYFFCIKRWLCVKVPQKIDYKKQEMRTLVPTSGPSCPSDKFAVFSLLLQVDKQAAGLVKFAALSILL